MKVLLSIKPRFVESILTGLKQYEFRKSIFKKDVSVVYIYSTSGVKRIVGYFKIDKIVMDSPRNLWKKYSRKAGIKKSEFFDYFHQKKHGFAIKIKSVKKFENPVDPHDLWNKFYPPQSYCYVDKEIISK